MMHRFIPALVAAVVIIGLHTPLSHVHSDPIHPTHSPDFSLPMRPMYGYIPETDEYVRVMYDPAIDEVFREHREEEHIGHFCYSMNGSIAWNDKGQPIIFSTCPSFPPKRPAYAVYGYIPETDEYVRVMYDPATEEVFREGERIGYFCRDSHAPLKPIAQNDKGQPIIFNDGC